MKIYQQIILILALLFFIGCNENKPKPTYAQAKQDQNTTENNITENNITSNISSYYKPPINTTWRWQLSDTINSSYNVDIYDIDLFDNSKETIQKLHEKGKKVICYFSAGSFENFRGDAVLFAKETLGNTLDGWDDEKWLDISNDKIKFIMEQRLDLAKEKKCDGVEPDNMDGYLNKSGFDLTYQHQLDYNKYIANQAHKRGLSVGLKNDLEQVKELEPYYDFAINEQCFQYNECELLLPFIKANKSVFNAEYATIYTDNLHNARDKICQKAKKLQFQTLILSIDLDDSFVYDCNRLLAKPINRLHKL